MTDSIFIQAEILPTILTSLQCVISGGVSDCLADNTSSSVILHRSSSKAQILDVATVSCTGNIVQ